MAAVHSALPRTVTLDWTTGQATARGTGKFDLAFSEIGRSSCARSTGSRAARTAPPTGTTARSSCTARQRWREGPVSLVETTHLQDDPDTPYRAALPLATELARALGVERRITEG